MSIGVQDSGSDEQTWHRPAEEGRKDQKPPGPEQGQIPLSRPGVRADLQLPEGET